MVSPFAAGCTAGSATVPSVVVRAQELAQRPNLPGRQPSHDLPALAQTQRIQVPESEQRQQATILHVVFHLSTIPTPPPHHTDTITHRLL